MEKEYPYDKEYPNEVVKLLCEIRDILKEKNKTGENNE